MKQILFTLACIIFSTPALAQTQDNIALALQEETLTPAQLEARNQRIQARVKYNETANFINNNYSKPRIKSLIDNNQSLEARVAKRQGKEAPTPLIVNPNDPAQVKLYINSNRPNVKNTIKNIP